MRDTVVGLEVELGEALGQTAYYLALLAGKDAAAREYERVHRVEGVPRDS